MTSRARAVAALAFAGVIAAGAYQQIRAAQERQTALKKLPPPGPIHWETMFGRRAPLVLDIGCGNGRFLLQSAVARPDHDHVGIDILPLVLRYGLMDAMTMHVIEDTVSALKQWKPDDTSLLLDLALIYREEGRVAEAAGDGIEAVSIVEAHPGPIDIVVTDVIMPRMSGPELAARLRTRNPEIRLLYVSGYTADQLRSQTTDLGADAILLAKPFTSEGLLRKVREVLDRPRPPAS